MLALVISTVAVWILSCTVIGVFAVEGALHLPRLAVTAEKRDRATAIADRESAIFSDAQVSVSDGVVLRAWSFRSPRGNGNAVILLHGQGDNRSGMLGPAEMLLRHGYSVLLPDAREHGESGGSIATYGVLEADDVRQWFEWLRKDKSTHCIYGLGDSMGGAELLRSLEAEHEFCAVISESSFATFRDVAFDRLGQGLGKGAGMGRSLLRPAYYAGLIYSRVRYGIDLDKADPAHAVAASTVPVLLIHGQADRSIPIRHAQMIRAKSPTTGLWEPAKADHCGASTAEPAEYERRVVGWFEQHKTQ